MRERAKANVAETLEFEKRVERLNVLENLIYEVKNAQAKITDQADTAVIEELISIGEDFMKDSKDATSAAINEKIKDIEDYFNPIKAKLWTENKKARQKDDSLRLPVWRREEVSMEQ